MTRRRDRKGSLRIKDGSWNVQWTEGNHRPSHTLGRVNELTKSEAQKLRREWMKKLNDHREVAGNSRTLAGFWCEYFCDEEKKDAKHELQDKKPSTARDMKWVMKQIWLPRFGERLLDGLGTAEIQKYLDSLNLNRNTAAKYRTYLSSVFSSAIRLGHGMTSNPARFVKLPAEGPERPYVMPTAEQVVAVLDGLIKPCHKMAWQLAVWLGNRSGELRSAPRETPSRAITASTSFLAVESLILFLTCASSLFSNMACRMHGGMDPATSGISYWPAPGSCAAHSRKVSTLSSASRRS